MTTKEWNVGGIDRLLALCFNRIPSFKANDHLFKKRFIAQIVQNAFHRTIIRITYFTFMPPFKWDFIDIVYSKLRYEVLVGTNIEKAIVPHMKDYPFICKLNSVQRNRYIFNIE